MKLKSLRFLIVPGLLTLGLAFVTTTVSAQDSSPKPAKAPSKANLIKYDANGDHQLDEIETAKMKADAHERRAGQHAEKLAKYDTNHDKKLSKDEAAIMKADQELAKQA
ncbi:MAG: hypothetical protein WCJ10_02485, partial [Opitutaceae bacterium]